ncbi:uncharacterized protein LOC112566943 [Pomacea canaliculata]|uniref:uncharacterized protein LOC112566943 n=1 Tax=Pomacea canaliculata TaxID=400727 RepID=UPI000D7287FD|nr:uncharacterized protein LOC112566943 [Pomacea canaliculata]
MASPNSLIYFQDKVVLHPRDDPINILSIEASRTIDKFILAFQPCVLVIGLFTNVFNGVVFWRQGLRDRMNLCLFCLSLADVAYLITVLIIVTVSSLMAQTGSRLAAEFIIKATVYGIGLLFGAAALSRLISMVIAVERCLCVVFPLQATSLIRTRAMASILVTIFTFVLLCYATKPVGMEAKSITDNLTGEVRWLTGLSPFYTNNNLLCQIIYNVIPRVVIPVGTFLIVLVATCITVVRLRAAMSWRQQASSNRGENLNQQVVLTKMLVVISCIDITCSTPSVIQALLEIFRSDFLTGGPLYNLLRTTGSLSTVFVCINSSVNFFVYITRSTRYRQEFQNLCCSRLSVIKVKQLNVIPSKTGTSLT